MRAIRFALAESLSEDEVSDLRPKDVALRVAEQLGRVSAAIANRSLFVAADNACVGRLSQRSKARDARLLCVHPLSEVIRLAQFDQRARGGRRMDKGDEIAVGTAPRPLVYEAYALGL